MNKMLLTSTSADPRVSPVDLLSQLSAGRASSGGGESSAGFAQLLQARVSVMGPSALPASNGSSSTQPQAGAAVPRAGAGPEQHKPASHDDATAAPERRRASSGEGARSPDGTKGGQRRSGEAQAQGKAGLAKPGRPPADTDAQDPVLAQVLRHLRAGDGDVVGDEAGNDSADETLTMTEDALAASAAGALLPSTPVQPAEARAPIDAGTAGTPGGEEPEALGNSGKGRPSAPKDISEGDARPGRALATIADSARTSSASLRAATGTEEALAQGLASVGAAANTQGQAAVDGMAADRSAAATNFAGALQQAQLSAAQGRGTAEHGSVRYELHAPLHSSGFAPEMAARLSLAAAEGVQQAQLHLHPEEMGPVQVQIVLDGQQAQISFMAEQADTRAVLEKSLPELAGALREQGLTLSGGGVFSQQQQAQSGQSSHANAQDGREGARWATEPLGPGDAGDALEAPGGSAAQATRSRGVLDLFA